MQQITQEDIEDLKKHGYSDKDIKQAIEETENENPLTQSYNEALNSYAQDPRAEASNSLISPGANDNLIQWQLELDSICERIEHMLRGDKPTYVNGSIVWKTPEDFKSAIFNEFGVAELMRIISIYINRNTILSFYREETIKEKVYDLGMEITDLIYLKYEEMFAIPTIEQVFELLYKIKFEEFMKEYIEINKYEEFERLFNKKIVVTEEGNFIEVEGKLQPVDKDMWMINQQQLKIKFIERMKDNPLIKECENYIRGIALEKRKLYSIVVRELVDICHSAYLRALHGGERESLREARTVNQTERTEGGVTINTGSSGQARGLLNPARYLMGKYK